MHLLSLVIYLTIWYNYHGDFMRVISGIYKGKKLAGFEVKGTRPTMDRVKESLFGMIQNYINDSTVLDLFAGTGSLGIEALSNGAKMCYFVDNGELITKFLRKNTENLKDAIIYVMDYQKALTYFVTEGIKFDIVFLDPPYHENMLASSLELIEKYKLLSEDGIVICEYENEELPTASPYFSVIKNKNYGDKKIVVYKV